MLIYDPDERISARRALRHIFFKPLRDLEMKSQNTKALSTMRQQFHNNKANNSPKNMDDTTVTDQNNLSDYLSPNQQAKKKQIDISNYTIFYNTNC